MSLGEQRQEKAIVIKSILAASSGELREERAQEKRREHVFSSGVLAGDRE